MAGDHTNENSAQQRIQLAISATAKDILVLSAFLAEEMSDKAYVPWLYNLRFTVILESSSQSQHPSNIV